MNMFMAMMLTLIGQGLIYVGIAFINKQLFPEVLASLYDLTNAVTRALIMNLVLAFPANLMVGKAFELVPPGIAGMFVLGTLMVVLVVNAILLTGSMISLKAWIAVCGTLLFAAWAGYELSRAPSPSETVAQNDATPTETAAE